MLEGMKKGISEMMSQDSDVVGGANGEVEWMSSQTEGSGNQFEWI